MVALLLLSLLQRQADDISVDAKADRVVQQMTLDEKITLISGYKGFSVAPIPRLGLRELPMADGPQGIRNFGPAPAYPGGLTTAATFDTKLAKQMGISLGRDARARKADIWLGPGVNLARIPFCGRNWEYYGEDPFLSGTMAVAAIQGAQSQGIAATVKHFAANNHENDRNNDSSEVSEQALRELYLLPFEMAVKEGGSLCIMSSYNLLNGVYTSAHPWLGPQVLRKDWGYQGVFLSDWGAVHSTVPTFKGALDLEMPNGDFFNPKALKAALASGAIDIKGLDERCQRIVRLNLILTSRQKQVKAFSQAQADELARPIVKQIAAEGIILLKNDKVGTAPVLPLDRRHVKTVVVFGARAEKYNGQGGGSGTVTPRNPMTILQGIEKASGKNVKVIYVAPPETRMAAFAPKSYKLTLWQGYDRNRIEVGKRVVKSIGGDWTKLAPEGINGLKNWSIDYDGDFTTQSEETLIFTVASDDGVRVTLDGKSVIDQWIDRGLAEDTAVATVPAGKHHLSVSYYQAAGDAVLKFSMARGKDVEEMKLPPEVATADAAFVVAGFGPDTESEGLDRKFQIPENEKRIIRLVAAKNPRTVVLLTGGGAMDCEPWINQVPGLIHTLYLGQEGAESLGKIIYGDINPSGRLPVTMPKSIEGTYYADAYPPKDHKLSYTEDLLLGYRWFDSKGVDPLFPFGFGLSYTQFGFEHATVNGSSVRVTVRNTGDRDGEEVVQVYGQDPAAGAFRPVTVLVGFARVFVKHGSSASVDVPLSSKNLRIWSKEDQAFSVPAGPITLRIGSSSRDLPLSATWDLRGIPQSKL